MNVKKLMSLSGWAGILTAGAVVGYMILTDIPQKAKEEKQRQEQFQKRHFALKVQGQEATMTAEKIQVSPAAVELIFKGDKRPATLSDGFWVMSNVGHIYACVQTTQFDCYEVLVDEKSIPELKKYSKNGIEVLNDPISKNAWYSFVEWDKKTNDLSFGEKVLIKAIISVL